MAVIADGSDHAGPGLPAQESGESAATAAHSRRARVRMAAAARGVPLATIIAAVAVVALTFLAGKLIYRPADISDGAHFIVQWYR